MDLEDALRQIQTDRANLTHGRLPRVMFNTSTLAHQGRWGASTPSGPSYAGVVNGDTVFTFDTGDVLIVKNIADPSRLRDDLAIV